MTSKFLFSLLLLLASAVCTGGATAVACSRPETCLQTAAVQRYAGTMDVVMSKGKTFKHRAATFAVDKDRLLCDFPKVGKMPGKTSIDLPVKVAADGSIAAPPGCVAGVIKLPMGLKLKLRLEALQEARMGGRHLSFILKVYGQMMGTKIPVSIRFRGEARRE